MIHDIADVSLLSDYLWGIETRGKVRRLVFTKMLSDYLWGIETLHGLNGAVSRLCFQTTYEELKPVRFIEWFSLAVQLSDYLWGIETLLFNCQWPCLSAFRLPMRNWNVYSIQQPRRLTTAFRLPMRNWNKWSFAYSRTSVFCFQTTYEELKLRRIARELELAGELPDYLW